MHPSRAFCTVSTTQSWLHSTHGRIDFFAVSVPARHLLTSSGSAMSARVISTRSAFPSLTSDSAMSASTTLPCAKTGTDTFALIVAARPAECPGAAYNPARVRCRL